MAELGHRRGPSWRAGLPPSDVEQKHSFYDVA